MIPPLFVVLRRANSDRIHTEQKLSLFQSSSALKDDLTFADVNGARKRTAHHTTSAGCLPDTFGYSTSAKLTDHFPQKTLTPSSSFKSSQLSPSSRKLSADAKAPVATIEDPSSPEFDDIDCVRQVDLETSDSSETVQNVSKSSESESDTTKTARTPEDSSQVGIIV